MFAIPPIIKKKYYVVVGDFGNQEWYLYNVEEGKKTMTRSWVNNPDRAIKFKNLDEAEQVGALVCDEDEFYIESFSVIS